MTDPEARNEEVKKLLTEHINPSLIRLIAFMGYDSIEDHAKGCHVFDNLGNDWLDCLGGYGVFSLGHAHPRVVEAVRSQLERMPLSCRVLLNEPLARLAARLAELAPGDLQYSFICNSGTEAIEGALKIARLRTGKHGIIYTEGAFHGKTLGSLSVTGREAFQRPFRPLIPGARMIPFGDADALEAAVDNDTACFVVEPIQGEGGIHVPPDDYLPRIQEICRKNGVIFIADEVQTGLGRTGKMFACEHWGVEPDLMTLAKALGGGVMPIGAIIGTPDVWSVFESQPLIHSSTFGGNPLACAAALATLQVIVEEDLPSKALSAGWVLMDGLREVMSNHREIIADVRGKGCLMGVEFTDSDIGGLMISSLAARRILVAFTLNDQSVLRVEPPLAIEAADMERLLDAFRESAAEVSGVVASLQ
jgi:putrescine aminotransferase